MRKILVTAYTFVLMNWAAVAGLYHFARGSENLWVKVTHQGDHR
jgi:hypothetical protein